LEKTSGPILVMAMTNEEEEEDQFKYPKHLKLSNI
jgi:hypothetical protein